MHANEKFLQYASLMINGRCEGPLFHNYIMIVFFIKLFRFVSKYFEYMLDHE